MPPLDPDVASVQSREELSAFLIDLAERVRERTFPATNTEAPDLIASAGYWVRAMDAFFANRGEQMPEAPDWSMIAMIFSAALVYE